MNRINIKWFRLAVQASVQCFMFTSLPVHSQSDALEEIDRGPVALCVDRNRAYVSWRMLEEDPRDVSFNLYRQQVGNNAFEKVNGEPVMTTTDYVDSTVSTGQAYRYRVKKIVDGSEEDTPGEATVFISGSGQTWYSIHLKGNGTPKRVGIGDLNGDGAYDFVIQHPDFNADPYYMPGYWKRSPETYKLEAYSSNGKFLWTYDMGWAIETGTWYAPYMVYDVDGNGKAEVYAKAGEGDPREMDGHVLEGPEYLVKIDGETGLVSNRVDWLSRDGFRSYNYWSRNFITVAYLNGTNPSLLMQRGTYGIIKTLAMDPSLQTEWLWEAAGEHEMFRGQGQHGIMVADIDFDGKDELIPGTYALDDNGLPLWQINLNHNDIGYVADILPSRPGMEVFYGIESRSPKNGVCLVDALTGELIWGYEGSTVHVHGQGMVGDIDPEHPGMECYAGESKGGDKYFLYSAGGMRLSDKSMGSLAPKAVWWDADDLKEINIGKDLFEYKGDTLLGIEGKVVLVADIIGDWREEIVTSLPGELRIYSTNIPAENRKVCLMQNRQYRLGVANASMGYFYPPQLGIPE